MATIYKYKQPPSSFTNILVNKTEHLNHILNVTANTLEYKLTKTKTGDEDSDPVLYNFKLDLTTLKSNNRFSDQSYWTFNANILPYEGSQQTLDNSCVLSIFDKSFNLKQRPFIGNSDTDYLFPLRLFVPSINSTFSDCKFFVLHPQDDTPDSPLLEDPWAITISVTPNAPNTFIDEITTVNTVMASITSSTNISSASVGTMIPVVVTCSDTSVSKVYLEPIVGVLDRTEVNLTSGTGNFNILTDTLTTGDIVKVKIGNKKYSNVNTFTKTIA
jgi:hypothetical protein